MLSTQNLLKRRGNKSNLAKVIQAYFPSHDCYVEPFFGAGGMFFNKQPAPYNILNDLDSEIYNLFNVVTEQKQELSNFLELMPLHADLLKYWLDNLEHEPVKKAARFLFQSNLILPPTRDLPRRPYDNSKKLLINNLEPTENFLKNTNCRFFNEDFRIFLDRMDFRYGYRNKEIVKTFIYCDPPYVDTSHNYSHGFKKQDFIDLLDVLEKVSKTYCSYAISEFDHPFVIESAKERGLNIIYLGERQVFKSRSTEILITNYESLQLSLF